MDSSISYNDDEYIESHLSKTQALEAAYEEALRKTDIIVKDEASRRLRLRVLMLENENDDLHEQLALGDDRIDVLEQEGDELRGKLEHAQEDTVRFEADARVQARELNNLRAELTSLNGVNIDTTKILTEKLSLAREIATLKPELEHLRSQTHFQQTILSEKLALQRQVSTLEVELETEKRASKRAAAKNDIKEREAELQSQVDALQKDLARQKKEAAKALKEREGELQSELEAARKELTREKKLSGKAQNEREAELQTQLESLQKDFARQKKEASKALNEREIELQGELESVQKDLARQKKTSGRAQSEREVELQSELENLHKDLARAKKDSVKARSGTQSELEDQLETLKGDLDMAKKEVIKVQKEAEKQLKASELRYTVLESKVEQLKTKLRDNKEQLKECQAELAQARAPIMKTTTKSSGADGLNKNPRKRSAADISSDINIGTPDGVAIRGKRPAANRGRKDQTLVGEKSMFSITPFLNKTINMASDTPDKNTIPDIAEEDEDEISQHQGTSDAQDNLEGAAAVRPDASSPTITSKAKGRKKAIDKPATVEKKPLAETKSNAQTKKPAHKKLPISTLEKVAEEDADENEEPAAIAPVGKSTIASKTSNVKPTKLQLKTVESDDAGPIKKKRKLLGGKTLFDEEDGEASKRPTKVTLGAPRLLGKGGLAGPKGGLKGGLGATGFGTFSPLKKDRRGVGASFLA